jgi:putative spermidine/putrescine transport system substrate-binding protein
MASRTSTEPGVSRRKFLSLAGSAGLGLGTGLALHGCSNSLEASETSGKRPYEGETLRVFIWAGDYEKAFRDYIAPKFKEQTGATMILDPGWWDSVPKLKVSPPGQPAFDLVVMEATQGFPAVKEGLYQKLDLSRIPNHKNLVPSALDTWVYKEGYGISFPDTVMTIAYNKKLVNFTPTSWADLFRDELKGKVSLYNSFYMSLYTFACIKVALDGKPGTAVAEVSNNLQGVLDFAKEHRDYIKYWWTTNNDFKLNLSQENCAIGNTFSNDTFTSLSSYSDLTTTVPIPDRASVLSFWGIPAGTRKKELAEEALNFLFSEEVQTAYCQINGAMTSVLPVAQKLAAKNPVWKSFYPHTEEQFETLSYYPYEAYFKDWDEIVQIWDRQILRQA